ncbi:MAG: TonB-dependent receptor [Terriglobia bacterium]|nr:TonB-dependent receptor [Terriglobia bacterium]
MTVTGEQPLIDTESAQQLDTVSNQQVQDLPLPKQDWTALLTQHTGTTETNNGNGAGLSFNGLATAAFNITVDGTNASNDPELPAFGFYQSPNIINSVNNDAISEVSVTKGIAPASSGGTMSGNVNVITKGGTNNFRGDLFEINDVSAMDARNWFLPTKHRSTFNQYGGSIGGPIIKNRLFFFGSYQGAKLRAFRAVTDDVPTPYLISISPSVYSQVFQAFPGVTQPAGDPTALTAQVTRAGSTVQNDGNGVARFDFYPSQSNIVTLRYIRSRPYLNRPNITLVDPRATTGHSDELNASLIHTGHSNWTSSTRFGYNRLRLDRQDLGFGQDLEQVKFGFDSQGAETFDKIGSTYSGEESIAINKGRHTIEFGGILQRQNAGRLDLNTTTLSYSDLSDFLNNIPSQVVITFDLPKFEIYTYQIGGYIQDDFKVTSNLTLNLGLRYDYFTVPKEAHNRIFDRGVDPNNPQLGPGFGPFRPADSMYKADFNNFSPRLGFSWGLGSDRKTVIRGGSGVFVGPHPIFGGPIEEVQAAANVPFRIYLNRDQAIAAGLQYPVTRDQYSNILANLQSSGVLSSEFANTAIDPNFPNPYSIQWMLGVERELPYHMGLSVSYVGSRGLKLNMVEIKNLPDRLTGVAPVPTFSQFRYYTPKDSSTYHSLQVSLSKQFSRGLMFNASYTREYNESYGDADLLLQNPPQDNNNLRGDIGPTPYDVPNMFTFNYVYDVPTPHFLTSNRAGKLVMGGWEWSGIVMIHSGTPWNILNPNSSYPSDRPDLIGNPYNSNWRSTPNLQYLNPAAFAAPTCPSGVTCTNNDTIVQASGAQSVPGTIRRNGIWGPGFWNYDTTVRKSFSITERVRFMLHADLLDAFNHPNFAVTPTGLVTQINKGSFGQLTSATNRQIQVGARLSF